MTVGILAATTETIGEEMTDLSGFLQTRLTDQALPEQSIQTDLNNASGTAGEAASSLAVDCTWDGTTTVVCSDTTGVVVGKYLRLDSDGQVFEIDSFVVNTSITILNPAGLTIPSGTGATSQIVPTVVTISSGAFLASISPGQRFRLTSGPAIGDSGLVNSRDSGTQLTLRVPISVPPASFGPESWEIVVDADTVISVESTDGWFDSGEFFLDRQRYRYSGKTAVTFTGLEHFDGAAYFSGVRTQHEPLAVVSDYTQRYSAVDQYRRSFMVRTAEGADLDVVGLNVGVPRPPELGEDELYQKLIQAIAYTPGGTIYAIERALDALFGETVIQESNGNIATASGDLVTVVAGSFTPDIEAGMRFRIKSSGEFLDETVLIRERVSGSSIRLQSTRLGDFSRLEWEITRKNWEIFEDLTGDLNHGGRVYVAEDDPSKLLEPNGKAYLEGVEETPLTSGTELTIPTPFLKPYSVRLKPEHWGAWFIAEGAGVATTDLGATINGPASTFPASIQVGDIFQLLDSQFAGVRGVVTQRVSDTQITIGLVKGEAAINANDDGILGVNFTGARFRIYREKSNVRFYKPSTEVVLDYPGDAGTTLWAFDGTGNEGTNVSVGNFGLHGSALLMDTSGGTLVYKRAARIHPESIVDFEICWDHDNAPISTTQANAMQMGMVISDGVKSVLLGVVDDGAGSQDVGFVDSSGDFIGNSFKWGGIAGTTFSQGLNAVRIRKIGTRSVQLWKEAWDGTDGYGFRLIDEVDYADFDTVTNWQTDSAGAYTAQDIELAYGAFDDTAAHSLIVKWVDWRIQSSKDFWNTDIPNGALTAGGELSDNDAAGVHEAGDVGQFVRIRDWTTLNGSGGNPRGLWKIDSFTDVDTIEIIGPTRQNAQFSLEHPDFIEIRHIEDAFSWPDHRGHAVEILTGANAGIYPILEIIDPGTESNVEDPIPLTAADSTNWVGASGVQLTLKSRMAKLDAAGGVPARPNGFAPEDADAEWRIIPTFGADAGPVAYEIVDTGEIVSGGDLELRTDSGYPAGTVVAVGRSQVLTAEVLDAEVSNSLVSPGVYENYPLYLYDAFGYVRRVVDLLTAAGVIAKFEAFVRDEAGPHILE